MTRIRIGTRGSRLAMIQAEMAARAISAWDPSIETELVPIKTTGDHILDRTLEEIGGKGLFVRELDAALLEGRVDFTVHSAKDLPLELDPRLPVAAASRREDPRDALVLPAFGAIPDKPLGSASARRRIQLARLFPGRQTAPIRGNVLTRLEKLDGGAYSGLVLAAAGLKRLGLEGRISRYFQPEELLPAACQGILAIQARTGTDTECLKLFHDPEAWTCMQAERAFIGALNGGCTQPCGAYAKPHGAGLLLRGMYGVGESARFGEALLGEEPEAEARALAERMKADEG